MRYTSTDNISRTNAINRGMYYRGDGIYASEAKYALRSLSSLLGYNSNIDTKNS
jgi:hypothetical protein